MTSTPSRRRALAWSLGAAWGLGGLCCAAPAAAQSYPAKPITFVVPFAAGSATDMLARALAQSITTDTKQTVIIDNKAGASGMIAAQAVARAPADGYTVLISTNTTHAANEHLYKKLAYDPVKDFQPVTLLAKGGQVLVVKADAPYKTAMELVAAARKAPGKLSFASGSASSRVAGELFQQLSGTEWVHVPYKSNPQALTDLMGGQVTMMIPDTGTAVPQLKAGKVRALGASTLKRLPVLPDVPTLDEAGVKGYDMSYWFAAYLPAGAPAAVVKQLGELLAAGTRSAGAKSFFDTAGIEPATSTPEGLAKFQHEESAKWGRVIKAAGIEPE